MTKIARTDAAFHVRAVNNWGRFVIALVFTSKQQDQVAYGRYERRVGAVMYPILLISACPSTRTSAKVAFRLTSRLGSSSWWDLANEDFLSNVEQLEYDSVERVLNAGAGLLD